MNTLVTQNNCPKYTTYASKLGKSDIPVFITFLCD